MPDHLLLFPIPVKLADALHAYRRTRTLLEAALAMKVGESGWQIEQCYKQ